MYIFFYFFFSFDFFLYIFFNFIKTSERKKKRLGKLNVDLRYCMISMKCVYAFLSLLLLLLFFVVISLYNDINIWKQSNHLKLSSQFQWSITVYPFSNRILHKSLICLPKSNLELELALPAVVRFNKFTSGGEIKREREIFK